MKKLTYIVLFLFSAMSFGQVTADSTAVSVDATEKMVFQEISVFPCIVNKVPMKFVIDSLNYDIKMSLVDADYLFQNNGITKEDLRMAIAYDLEKKGTRDNMRFNVNEIIIGDLILNNVDVIVEKNQQIPLVFGNKIADKLGKISINDQNKFTFKNLTEPYVPIKFDMTDDEFSANQRIKLIDEANLAIRQNLVSNLRRFVRGNEKDEAKELRSTLTFKVDVASSSRNDERYNEEVILNQKTVIGKMMFETYKLINPSEMSKEVLKYYDETSFNILFIYSDKTVKLKYLLTRENLTKLPIPFTKEEFLQSLTTTKK